MPFNQIVVEVPEKLKEVVVAEFSGEELAGVWEQELPDERSRLTIYFDPSSDFRNLEDRVCGVFERAGEVVPEVRAGVQEDMDWTLEWRKGYTSFDLGRGFRVVPSWEEPPRSGERQVVRIDPGQAFGTGTHETTQMIIEALEKCEVRDANVLDLGTGSGILSIAAMKLGWSRVAGCDLDREAATVAAANFERNFVPVDLFVGSIDAVGSASVGLLLANLTGDTIRGVLPEISRVLMPGSHAILSGLLGEQAEALGSLLIGQGYSVLVEETRGEWVVLVVRHGD